MFMQFIWPSAFCLTQGAISFITITCFHHNSYFVHFVQFPPHACIFLQSPLPLSACKTATLYWVVWVLVQVHQVLFYFFFFFSFFSAMLMTSITITIIWEHMLIFICTVLIISWGECILQALLLSIPLHFQY